MERYFVALLAVLLTTSIAGFCAYVALVPLLVVSFVLLGMALTFVLGVYFATGTQSHFLEWAGKLIRRYTVQMSESAR